ncbi:protein SSUH2 homolog [Trichonephila clavipes]|uniref:Protein SSUH2 homolog n=1 Tax=Trichonephila clavipes TaxID=2585209 RepID=A0A8X6RCA3_TRICX|nr:protein SSUH2 homolog [Trichonephila clavipes]
MERGDSMEFVGNYKDVEISVTALKGNKTVIMASTFAGEKPLGKVMRYDKTKNRVEIIRPHVIKEYNKHVGVSFSDIRHLFNMSNFGPPPGNPAPYPNHPYNTQYPTSPTGNNTSYPTSPVGNNTPYPNYPPGNNTPYPATYYPTHTGYPSQQPQMMDYSNPGVPQPGTFPPNYPQPGTVPQNYPQPQIGGDCPVPGGNFQPEVCPTAPDISQLQKIPGYEGVTFDNAVLQPPSFPVWEPTDQSRKPVDNLPTLTDDEVHSAVTEYASEHCCYGSAVGRDMQVKEITMMSAFHYKLETFAEKRESAWRFEPYRGQAIDGPSNGPAPAPWDIQALPEQEFKNGTKKYEVPHTAFVKPCHTCVGNARVRCSHCEGNGRVSIFVSI